MTMPRCVMCDATVEGQFPLCAECGAEAMDERGVTDQFRR